MCHLPTSAEPQRRPTSAHLPFPHVSKLADESINRFQRLADCKCRASPDDLFSKQFDIPILNPKGHAQCQGNWLDAVGYRVADLPERMADTINCCRCLEGFLG